MPNFIQTMQSVLTIAVVGVALYVIINPADRPEAQKWAFGVIGTLIGFWLRGP